MIFLNTKIERVLILKRKIAFDRPKKKLIFVRILLCNFVKKGRFAKNIEKRHRKINYLNIFRFNWINKFLFASNLQFIGWFSTLSSSTSKTRHQNLFLHFLATRTCRSLFILFFAKFARFSAYVLYLFIQWSFMFFFFPSYFSCLRFAQFAFSYKMHKQESKRSNE